VISDNSFEFYYNYLFIFFVEGVAEIGSLLATAFPGDYDPGNPWYSLDSMFARFWSKEVWAKISSLLFSHPLGIPFLLIYLVAVLIAMFAILMALMMYLKAYIMIALMIVLFPLFIVFLLFGDVPYIVKTPVMTV